MPLCTILGGRGLSSTIGPKRPLSDHHCSRDIAISDEVASTAIVRSLRQEFPRHVSATRTFLRRSARVYFHQFATSVCSFDAKDFEENRPSDIIHRLGQPPSGHPFYVQLLDGDSIEAIHNVSGNAMSKS